jgi:ZIP family zinc transporter
MSELHPVLQALIATCFTWFMTASGAAIVFATKTVSRKLLDSMLGFAAGVMISASYWSLLAPAIEMSERNSTPAWLPAVAGFLLGGVFLRGIDRILPHLHIGAADTAVEGVKTKWHRSTLLATAMTIHNIPEGLAVGVAFGAAALGVSGASLAAATSLAIGVGIQNLPEGLAISVPLRGEGLTRLRSFWYGQLSAIVEPIAGVIGAALVFWINPLLSYALSFAAGAMIFVVIEDLVPEAQRSGNTDIATMSGIGGFAIMMFLDLAFG